MLNTFNFGQIAYENDIKKNLVTVEIGLKDDEQGRPCFTASGEIWNSRQSDCVLGGQCLDDIAKYVDDSIFKKIHRLWKLYHLNDMNAGTQEQDKVIKEWQAQGNKYDYTAACEYLKSIGLYEVEFEGKPFKYGYGWIYYPIADNDLKEIKELLKYNY